MEIEKTLAVAAPADKIWSLLLDPQVMGGCVPGMQSIEVVSEVEYVAVMHVKISFVSARFRLKTKIVEQRRPHYLRTEGTGEDASVASSLKQSSEIFLEPLPDGRTELKMKVQVDVLGRLGSFGLGVMKTKADRMWDEFGRNLVAKLEGTGHEEVPPGPAAAGPAAAEASAVIVTQQPVVEAVAPPGWLGRLLSRGRGVPADSRCIRIEVRREGATVTVHWPVEAAGECAALLRECLRQDYSPGSVGSSCERS